PDEDVYGLADPHVEQRVGISDRLVPVRPMEPYVTGHFAQADGEVAGRIFATALEDDHVTTPAGEADRGPACAVSRAPHGDVDVVDDLDDPIFVRRSVVDERLDRVR